MDKLREEFEKQIREDLLFDDEELEWQPERNCYAIYGVHLAWWGYRASRAAIVVELPEYRSAESYQSAGYNEALDDCDSALRSIGLSIKGE
ncbi:hypothetical protein LL394_005266 [Serratia marcescens]|uniref:hypothetical protein n=1 Tax=Serratia TaxID=613 RepID=UPI001A20C0C6|nr:hypothetical protein [Serratia marcescens]HAT3746268.1 hypothetical protein [Serratia marcescens]HAT3802101.1 hypothetical protein [Serratia marcescens]